MKNQKLCAILIAAAFVVSAILSCAILLSVKKVETRFVVGENTDVSRLSADLDGLKGKSLLFSSKKDVEEILKNHPYFYLADEPSKKFPNVISLTVKERLEVYRLTYGEQIYILDQDGYLLSIESQREQSRELIDLCFDGVEIKDAVLSETLKVNDDKLFADFLDTAKSIDLTDNVKSVSVVSQKERKQLLFETYTGVTIEISSAESFCKEQAVAAFTAFVNDTDDFYKWKGTIMSVLKVDGEINVVWNKLSPDGIAAEKR